MVSWFKKLSLTNKIAFATLITAITTLVFSFFPIDEEKEITQISTNQKSTGNHSPNINTNGDVNISYKDNSQKREIYNILTSLDKVKNLLPIDVNLQECLESKREKLLKIEEIPDRISAEGTNYSRCLLRMKQEFKSPEWMIRQHTPLLEELSKENPEIISLIGDVIFKIREMQNNQHQHEVWLTLGCPNEIKYVKGLEMDKFHGSCIFVVEDTDLYKDRIVRTVLGQVSQKPNDIYSQVGKVALDDVNVEISVVPKNQDVVGIGNVVGYDTVIEQTVYLNEKIYQDMEKDLFKLKNILLNIIEE